MKSKKLKLVDDGPCGLHRQQFAERLDQMSFRALGDEETRTVFLFQSAIPRCARNDRRGGRFSASSHIDPAAYLRHCSWRLRPRPESCYFFGVQKKSFDPFSTIWHFMQ